MTTPRTSWAVAREAAGLLLTAVGVLGVLVALSSLHWAAGLIAAAAGMTSSGLIVRRSPSRLARLAGTGAAVTGYGVLTGCAFSYSDPLGWLAASLAAGVAGIWLASREGA
ncbi:hypothetical protein ACIO3O_37370 [Streptomyces sp. NPDC087440]|uniref:hypothetical protein n=1 Tax=Streptomyces sp. NPDC087440 TaxID=3365790 RepID=UPI00382EF956